MGKGGLGTFAAAAGRGLEHDGVPDVVSDLEEVRVPNDLPVEARDDVHSWDGRREGGIELYNLEQTGRDGW